MDYSKLVPSMELCEEMARLNICQDGPELFWNEVYKPHQYSPAYRLETLFIKCDLNLYGRSIIAPTLSRMMEELPKTVCGGAYNQPHPCSIYKRDKDWLVSFGMVVEVIDKHLPNAVAKALIALKKGMI